MAEWRFYSVAIAGGAPLAVRDELPLGNVSIVDRLKGVGSLAASIPLRHPKATSTNLDDENTLIVAERDGVVVWAGPLLNTDLSVGAENISLQCEGVWNLIRRRVIRSNTGMTYGTSAAGEVRFSAVDQFRIVEDLIAHMNTVRDDLGLTVAYDSLSGQTRDRTYEADKAKSLGEAIEQLSDVQNGFDWAVEVGGTVDDLTFTLRLSYPRRGRDTGYRLDWYAPLTTTTAVAAEALLDGDGNPILDGDGLPITSGDESIIQRTSTSGSANVLAMGLSSSSRDRIARFTAVGPGEGTTQLVAHAEASEAVSVLPLIEGGGSWQDVSNTSTLTGHAERHATLHGRRILVPSFTLDPAAEPELGSWIVGDIFDCSIDDGAAQLPDGQYRSIARTINLSDDGAETVDVDLVALGVFG